MSDNMFVDGFWGDALGADADINWLWRGLLAAGKTTLLTALWKSGKTTLLAHLLAHRHTGGDLLELPVRPGVTAVLSEEGRDLWAMRLKKLDLGGKTCFVCRPYDARPSLQQVHDFVGHILKLKTERGVDLLVVDTLARFLPTANENNAGTMVDALGAYAGLTRAGLGLLYLHHPRKDDPGLGLAARGSGALTAAVDISLEMRHPGGDPFTRRRRLCAWSRFDETPQHMLIELSPDHTHYTRLPDDSDDFQTHWDTLRLLLSATAAPMTRRDLHRAWPGLPKPSDISIWKWLTRAVDLGLAHCEGKGTKTDPFRYGLTAKERDAA
jgi:hypothetical protein